MNTRPLKAVGPIQRKRLLSIKSVCDECDLSETTVRDLMKAGKFPIPVYVTPTLPRWRGCDIDNWIGELDTLGQTA